MLSPDLADLYQVETRSFNQSVKRNLKRFPNNFRFQLTKAELMEEFGARREARDKREGKREAMLAMAKRLLANGKLMLKEIAECTGLSLAQVKKLQASMA